MWLCSHTNHFEGKKPDTLSVEQCISKGVFGRDRNVFDDFRKEAAQIQIKENTAIGTDNKQLKKKIPVMDFGFMEWTQNQNSGLLWPNVQSKEEQKYEERYKVCRLLLLPDRKKPTCSLWNNVTKRKWSGQNRMKL